ncbi:MAG: NAD(P)H-hydrate dehydratase [Chloroflexi bacterium]|nr:NAD(P)H-hydrate dehydratase [Chloroflexota bacterium]
MTAAGSSRGTGDARTVGLADMPPVVELDDSIVAGMLPLREARAHKGSHGTLLVVCGSLDYAGAAHLVATAAGRGGAGLVCLAVPASLQPLFAGRPVEAITLGLPEGDESAVPDPDGALAAIAGRSHDALAIGSGLRPGPGTVMLVQRLVAGEGHGGVGALAPAVLDAEALNSLATLEAWWTPMRRACVLTPHPGEFRRLRPQAGGDLGTDDAAREAACRGAAAVWSQTVVLKGGRTVVAAPDGRAARAPFENPALGTAGTGDVLTGVIGALLAQGVAPYEAACIGVYLHGVAGDRLSERVGDAGLLASDLPYEVALARRRLSEVRERLATGQAFGFGARAAVR